MTFSTSSPSAAHLLSIAVVMHWPQRCCWLNSNPTSYMAGASFADASACCDTESRHSMYGRLFVGQLQLLLVAVAGSTRQEGINRFGSAWVSGSLWIARSGCGASPAVTRMAWCTPQHCYGCPVCSDDGSCGGAGRVAELKSSISPAAKGTASTWLAFIGSGGRCSVFRSQWVYCSPGACPA